MVDGLMEQAAEQQGGLAGLISRSLAAQKVAEETETVLLYDEASESIFRVRTTHAEIARKLPASCRWVPDYRLLRKIGMIVGWGMSGLVLFFAVVAGVKFDAVVAAWWIGGITVLVSPIIAWVCWDFAPRYRGKGNDYVPFSVIRRITKASDEPVPHGAWPETQDTPDGRIAYIVPYQHTFLNLQNPSEEATGERHHPFVARASVLFNDSKMEDATFIMSAKPDTWSRMKVMMPFGVIVVELIFLFLMLNTMQG